MTYIEGFLIPVPEGAKQAFIDHARLIYPIFLEYGATRVVEAWGDDVPHGEVTDFYRAVAAGEGEAVAFSWIEWPDKATRDAGMAKIDERMKTDPIFDPANTPVPFDGKRMVFGGFEAVVEMGER